MRAGWKATSAPEPLRLSENRYTLHPPQGSTMAGIAPFAPAFDGAKVTTIDSLEVDLPGSPTLSRARESLLLDIVDGRYGSGVTAREAVLCEPAGDGSRRVESDNDEKVIEQHPCRITDTSPAQLHAQGGPVAPKPLLTSTATECSIARLPLSRNPGQKKSSVTPRNNILPRNDTYSRDVTVAGGTSRTASVTTFPKRAMTSSVGDSAKRGTPIRGGRLRAGMRVLLPGEGARDYLSLSKGAEALRNREMESRAATAEAQVRYGNS